MSEKTPKDAKQHGALNNYQAGSKQSANDIRSTANTVKLNKDGTYEFELPPAPIVNADRAGITTMKFSDGRYVEVNSNATFSSNISVAYGPHGVRNAMIIGAESIAKGTSVKNPYAMALVWLARVGLSTTKKMVVEDHGETYGFWKALIYGVAANTKLTTPGYFGKAFKGSERFQKIAHASHELHHAIDKFTFKPFGVKGSNSTLGDWAVNPLSLQAGASQLENKYVSGATIFYAIKGHGGKSGNHGASEGETHPQTKIGNETHKSDVKNSHNAKSAESHAVAEPIPALDKESAKELLLEFGKEAETQQVLWIAWNLNQTNNGRRGNKFIDDDNMQGGELVDLSKVKITEDIAFAQELLKKSGLDYYQATNNKIGNIPDNFIKAAVSLVTDNAIFDLARFTYNALGFGTSDEEERARTRGLNLIAIQAAGGKITYEADGSVKVKINPKDGLKASTDNAKLPAKPTKKLTKDIVNEKKEAQAAYEKLTGWNPYNMNVNSAEYKQFKSNKAFQNGKQFSSNFGVGVPLATGGVRTQMNASNARVMTQLFNK